MTRQELARRRRRRRLSRTAGGLLALLALAVGAAAVLIDATAGTPRAGASPSGVLGVVTITPSGAQVPPDAMLRVAFNQPLSSSTPLPSLVPGVPGTWVRISPTVLAFRTRSALLPGRAYTVTVPSGTTAASGAQLGHNVVRRFSVALGSVLRLHQLLGELGYLPLRFIPTGPNSPASSAVQPGVFAWRWRSVPDQLTALWHPTAYTVITQGAIMRFEDVHGMPTDGLATSQLWKALLAAAAAGRHDPNTYDYVAVSTSLPETLTLYVDNHVVYSTYVNTGISVRPTALETNPVYVRYTSTTMSGTNPDGSHYSDPGIPWVSYFHGGEALHGYIRSSYGWPQSLGCVEMPYANAKIVWPFTPIGTLVTVH